MNMVSYRECVSSFCLPFSVPRSWQSTAIRTNATAMKGEMDNTVGMPDCIHPKWLSATSTISTREQFLLEEIASFMPVDSMPICRQPFLCITSMGMLILHNTAMCSVTAHDWTTATIAQTCANPSGSRFGPTWTTRSSPIVRRNSRVSMEMSRNVMAH